MPFEGEKYKNSLINASVEVSSDTVYSEKDRISTLLTLFEKGVINREQLINRLPDGFITDKKSLINQNVEVEQNDGN